MVFLVHFSQLWLSDVSINLGGGDVLMTKHLLYIPQTRSVAQQVGGKTVSNAVWGQFNGQVSPATVPVNQPLHASGGQTHLFAVRQEVRFLTREVNKDRPPVVFSGIKPFC